MMWKLLILIMPDFCDRVNLCILLLMIMLKINKFITNSKSMIDVGFYLKCVSEMLMG
jgi:hypothetical protein